MWIDGSCLIWVQSAAGSVTGSPSTLPDTVSLAVCPGGELVPKRDVDWSPLSPPPRRSAKPTRLCRAPGPSTQQTRPRGRAGRGETVHSQIPGPRGARVSGGSSHFLRKWPRALVKAAFSRSPPPGEGTGHANWPSSEGIEALKGKEPSVVDLFVHFLWSSHASLSEIIS